MRTEGVEIPVKATVDAAQLGALEGSINALRAQLKQAKADFDAAAPGSTAWTNAAERVADLNVRVMDALKPLREVVEANIRADAAQRQLNAAIAAGVNPWTTASAKYREAQAALQAQTAAAKEAAQASAALTRAKAAEGQSMRADAMMAAQRQMAQDMRDSETATRRLNQSLDDLPDKNKKVEKSSSSAARGVLEVSRAFEDAQYGISGVLNNLPNIITMFGGGAGLAGVLSIVAVSATILAKRLDKANFDGTWIGDVKDSFNELINGMTKAEAEARAIAEAPPTWAKNAEQEFEARSKLAEQALQREIELMKTKLEIQKSISAARAEEFEHAEKLHKIQNPNTAEKGSAEWAKNEEVTKSKEWQTREANRVKGIKDAESEKLTADQEAAKLTADAAAERKKADDQKKFEDNARIAAQMTADAEAAEKRMKDLEWNDRNAERNNPEWKQQQETARLAREGAQKYRDANVGLHADSGTTAAAAEELAKEKELEAQKARDAAAKEAREFEAAKVKSRQEMQRNDAQLKRDREDIGAAQFEKAAKDQEEERKKKEDERTGKNRTVEKLPDTNTAPAPAEGVSNEDYEAARSGLRNMANQSRGSAADGGAGDSYRQGLGALDAAVGDGKGDTSAEVQVIERMRESIERGKVDRATALQRALSEMEALQANGSEMEQRLTSTLSAFAQTMASLASRLSALESEVNTINSNRVR